MSKQKHTSRFAIGDAPEFTRDTTLEVLSNQRRRFTIHYLKQHDDRQVSVSELATQVAAWEYDKDPNALAHQERKRVQNALRQFHLPKMDDYGFIEYDAQRGTVILSEAAASTNFYVDSLTGSNIPWGAYYLALSALGLVLVLGLWANLYPFSLVSPLTSGVFFVTALAVSSVGHFYDNYYRMRLGARDRPPEVDDE